MTRAATQIGPADHGRRMTLEEFELAEGQPGYTYELSRGEVTVVDVPDFAHGDQVDALRQQLSAYRASHPRVIYRLFSGSECKILLEELNSERHPDLAVYRTAPEEPGNWATWIPEIVVEFVSPSSRSRDYDEKPEEYFRSGIREYWIVDRADRQMLVYRRVGGRWVRKVVRDGEKYRSTILPGFELDLAAVFNAVNE